VKAPQKYDLLPGSSFMQLLADVLDLKVRLIADRSHLSVMYGTVHKSLDYHSSSGDHMASKPDESLIDPIAYLLAAQGEVAIPRGSQPESTSMITVVHLSGLSTETQQTSGSLRMSAIAAMQGIVSSLWAGIFVVEPSAKTGIHHHGEQDTVV
jgi:hypothetical protein